MKQNNYFKTAAFALSFLSVSAFAQFDGTGYSDDLPPNPEFGKCYAKCKTPDVYETVSERVLVQEEGTRVITEPERFETADETVMVKEPSQRIEVVPAEYETVTEQVLVKPASKKVVDIPAKYETVTEKLLVRPESGQWVKKRVSASCLSANPEDCFVQCYEKIPAEYKTVTRRVLVTPATTQETEIPAEYTTVTRKVIKTPATTRVVEIPAEYKTIKKKVLANPSQTRTEIIPAEYKDINKRVLVRAGGFTGWEEILCDANVNYNKISTVQRALKEKGYDPGPIDGVMGSLTKAALEKYQADNGLPVGNLNIKTLESLGIN
ncbi:MAG: peptidoglycan-binding domain-containing protein [Chitinophagales bacterium]|nr:peptidoglycan-binding protein [Bacteroidota bacterium]